MPHDDEFKFRARAQELVSKWHHMIIGNEPKPSPPPAAKERGITIKSVVISTQTFSLNEKSMLLAVWMKFPLVNI